MLFTRFNQIKIKQSVIRKTDICKIVIKLIIDDNKWGFLFFIVHWYHCVMQQRVQE